MSHSQRWAWHADILEMSHCIKINYSWFLYLRHLCLNTFTADAICYWVLMQLFVACIYFLALCLCNSISLLRPSQTYSKLFINSSCLPVNLLLVSGSIKFTYGKLVKCVKDVCLKDYLIKKQWTQNISSKVKISEIYFIGQKS